MTHLGHSGSFSGTDTTQYKAVRALLADITTAIRAIPGVKEKIHQKFIQEVWIEPSAACSEAELAQCALEKIRQDSTQFSILVKMIRETAGMDIIAGKLEEKNSEM